MTIGRFAPTPSGQLHLGNIACAMIAWLSAKAQGGQCLLRIEDVDVPRCPRRLAQDNLAALDFFSFRFDGKALYQSERTAVYEEYLRCLEKHGLIYPCFCTRARLQTLYAPNLGDTQVVYDGACRKMTQNEIVRMSQTRSPSLRLAVPDESITFTDRLQGTVTENLQRDCGDFVLKRADGLFGYQLAAVVDDALSGVTEVVRGRDILSSTPRQIYLQRCLSFPSVSYLHIPLLMGADGHRLSKRLGDTDVQTLSKRYTPEMLLGLLAHACGIIEEEYPVTLEQLIPLWDEKKLPKEDMHLHREL